MPSKQARKIQELQQELDRLNKIDLKKKDIEKEKIGDLKAKIREKKYAKLKRVGRNLKIIGSAVGKGLRPVGKMFLGICQQRQTEKQKVLKKIKPYNPEDILKRLPQ